MPIAEETVVHVLGECPALNGPRKKFLDRRQRKMGGPDEPEPKRIATWILRDDPEGKQPAEVVRAAAEFAADMMQMRGAACRALNIW